MTCTCTVWHVVIVKQTIKLLKSIWVMTWMTWNRLLSVVLREAGQSCVAHTVFIRLLQMARENPLLSENRLQQQWRQLAVDRRGYIMRSGQHAVNCWWTEDSQPFENTRVDCHPSSYVIAFCGLKSRTWTSDMAPCHLVRRIQVKLSRCWWTFTGATSPQYGISS